MNRVKLKYKNTYIQDIVPGTTLYEISRTVQKDFSYPIIGAKLNNVMVDLTKPILENGTVDFYDRSSSIGNRIYGRSLEFLIIVAAKEVLRAESDILINYSLDNGIYCEVIGQRITQKHIDALDIKMQELINENIIYTKSVVSRFDAIKYFKNHNQPDKVKNLSYTSNSTVDLNRLNGVYDYFFGPLVYSTGQTNKFKITYLKDNSFVISYPSLSNPRIVTKYKHHEKVFEKYKEYESWGRLIDIDMVADLNDLGAKGEYGDAIRLFEAHYESELSAVAEKIARKKDLKLILLSGPSSSGKTTTSKKLSLYLKAQGLKPHQISLDDYFVDREKTPKDENGEYDYASIKSTDTKLFNEHLTKLLNGERVCVPHFDFVTGKKFFKKDYLQLGKDDVLIVEGIHTLNDVLTKSIKRENKFKVYVTPIMQLKIDNHNRVRTTDVRKIRRIVRDSRYRGITADATLKIWHNVDKEANENIYPYQDDVDVVINSALNYEMGVLRIFAEPLLYGINPNSDVYPEAIRLINLLRQFLPISSEEVPKDSILREFIGEGVFNE